MQLKYSQQGRAKPVKQDSVDDERISARNLPAEGKSGQSEAGLAQQVDLREPHRKNPKFQGHLEELQKRLTDAEPPENELLRANMHSKNSLSSNLLIDAVLSGRTAEPRSSRNILAASVSERQD